jgi:hypothetical protein
MAYEQLVHRLEAADAAGSYDELRGFFTDDIIYNLPGRNLIAGKYTGIDAVVGLYMQVGHYRQAYPVDSVPMKTSSGPTFVARTKANTTSINGLVLHWQDRSVYFFRKSLIEVCWLFIDNLADYDMYWSTVLHTARDDRLHSSSPGQPGLMSGPHTRIR